MSANKSSLSQARSYQETGAFLDTHDVTEFWDATEPVEFEVDNHIDAHIRHLIASAVTEVDPRQIAIYRRLTPAHRIRQLAHLSDWLRQANLRRQHRQIHNQ
ncbi:MAG: hypothetical protein JXR84_03940 [Anaerolineae bacterium]|nr:hypothetical protein [Anaerolineae bacterium]